MLLKINWLYGSVKEVGLAQMYENMPYFCLLRISSFPHCNFVAIYSHHSFTTFIISEYEPRFFTKSKIGIQQFSDWSKKMALDKMYCEFEISGTNYNQTIHHNFSFRSELFPQIMNQTREVSPKVIIDKSRGEVSLMEQDTMFLSL